MIRSVFALLLLAFATGQAAAQSAPPAPSLTRDAMMDFVAQWICLDQKSAITVALPLDSNCIGHRSQTSVDPVGYRKYAWTSTSATADTLGGHASDSVIQSRGGQKFVLQTFDTSPEDARPTESGRAGSKPGSGGQVLLLSQRNWISLAMADFGDDGTRWFPGERCAVSSRAEDRFDGRMLFHARADATAWNSVVARAGVADRADACPRQFSDLFTRYRRDRVMLPFRMIPIDAPSSARWQPLDAIVSEQFNGVSPSAADRMDRLYFARGLGLVRWERWTNKPAPQAAVATARCPVIERYGAPAGAWQLSDCRMWTVLAAQRGIWSVDDYRWPALDALGPVDKGY